MNPAATNEFRENRSRFTLEQLKPYADQWVAFSRDGRSILANGASISDVADRLAEDKMSLNDVVLDHIVFDTNEIYLGAAEFT